MKKILSLIIFSLFLSLCGYGQNSKKEYHTIAVMTSNSEIIGAGVLFNSLRNDEKDYVVILNSKNYYRYLDNVALHWCTDRYSDVNLNSIKNFKHLISYEYYSVKQNNIYVDIFEIDKGQFKFFTDTYVYNIGWNRSPTVNVESEYFSDIYSSDNIWEVGTYREELVSSCENERICNEERFWFLDLPVRPSSGYLATSGLGFPLLDDRGRVIGLSSGIWDYTPSVPVDRSTSHEFRDKYLYLKFDALWKDGLGMYLDPDGIGVDYLDGAVYGNNDISISNDNISNSLNLQGRDIVLENVVFEGNGVSTINGEVVILKPSFVAKAKEGKATVIKSREKESKLLKTTILKTIDASSLVENATSIATTTQLFPNPTDGILNFECSDVEAKCDVKIYSISGGVVYSNSAQQDGDVINLGAFAKGMYLAKITVGGETTTQKIILK